VFGKLKKVVYILILTLWSLKMDNGVVVLEHVDFIDILESLHTELFDGSLDFLILVHLWGAVNNLLGSSLSSYKAERININVMTATTTRLNDPNLSWSEKRLKTYLFLQLELYPFWRRAWLWHLKLLDPCLLIFL
jgi:hypothetical protein